MSCCGEYEETTPLNRPTPPGPAHKEEEEEEDSGDPFALHQCRHCRRVYKAAENNPTACTYHPGKYMRRNTQVFSSTEWSCCKSVSKNEKGCRTERHRRVQ